ncbi:MAG: DUF6398 domain-containing protein, partial [Acidimicrobiales bacterium]
MGTRRRQPPDLMVEMRRVLGADHPLPLLTLVSSLLAAVDPRASNPLGPPVAPRDDLRRTLVEVDQPETTAVLKAMAALTPDDLERRRIRQVVDARRHPLPVWMGEISRVEAYRATELAHALGDCDSLSVGARFPSGEELTVVAYIDHNLGTVLRDAFVVPEPIATVLALFQSKDDNPDTTMAELGPASARARLTEAIDRGASLFPPLVTDTWPGCRLLVEWVARLLPAGGSGYPRREWSDGDRHALAARFFASPHSAGLDHPDFGLLLERVLWFACDDGAGDPMRWSPATVEVVLTDWFPRKVMGATRFLHKLPRLLRAFIRFCHAERSLRPELTAETLGAVDRWEPDYRKGVRTPRPVDAAAWLAAIGAFAGDDEPDDDLDYFDGYDDGPGPVDHQAILRDTLAGEVGGPAALAALAADPLPDEPFSWESIPSDVHGEVARVLAG